MRYRHWCFNAHRVALSIVIVLAWIMLIVALIPYAPSAFKILVYSDSKVLPHWTEASLASNIVNRYLGNQAGLVVIPVYVGNVNNSRYVLSAIDSELRSLNLTYYDLNNVYDKIINHYYNITNETVKEYLSNYTSIIQKIYTNESSLCSELYNISNEYYSTFNNYTSTVREFSGFFTLFVKGFFTNLSTMDYSYSVWQVINETGQALLNNGNYSSWLKPYLIYFIKSLNDSVGNLPIYGLNISLIKWALSTSYHLTLVKINNTYVPILRNLSESNPLALPMIALGPNPPRTLTARLVASWFINSTPPLLKPYLIQLACANESQVNTTVNELNYSLSFIVLSIYRKPAYSYANNITNGSLYSGGYALVIVNSTNDMEINNLFTNYDYVYPFSTSIVLSQLSEIIEKDVPMIDEVSGVSVLLMLLFVLGTLVAPIIILMILILSYGAVLGVVYFLGKMGLTVYYLTVYMISPIVFGIGVDYSLLIIGRYLEERRRGFDTPQALGAIRRFTIPTIFTSGSVVAAGLGSFIASNYQYIQVIGLSYIITVAFIILATTVVLPSLIILMNDRILWPMGLKSSTRELSTSVIIKLTRFSLRRPWLIIAIALVPTAFSMLFIIENPVTSDPLLLMPNIKSVYAYRVLVHYFPNYVESTQYIILEPNNVEALQSLKSIISSLNFTRSVNLAYNSSSIAILKVTTSYNALSDRLIPVYVKLTSLANQVANEYGIRVIIGGDAANKYYFVKVFENQFYYKITILIIALNILLLSLALRSIVVPLRLLATVMMSISWSLAVSQLIFYKLLGVETYWLLPIILFALLTSVGTDYDIFIVTRVREEITKGKSDLEAILTAVENTGPIVTGAALVLAIAFMSLMVSQLYILREIGFTVGLSVLIDAFLIRPAVMPAIMVLAGKYNWWPSKIRVNQSAVVPTQ
ncbi:MMPL family transporter [Caldivirga sp. UBA161]|uniref:MMPL family transporter n=1 Tax=Caldivirga sp. UBA161 TaxID=1915569 RepID=UPI0025C5A39A|nr:MMPL family transporter [Caldivirga sp. UBA161]